MKRKLITKLIQLSDPANSVELVDAVPDQGGDAVAARTVLAAALVAIRRQGVTDAAQFYKGLCSTTAEQLHNALEGTPAAGFSVNQIAAAQRILQNVLTSKAGRPASTTPEDRAAQVKAAQARRRQKLATEEGRKQLSEWISVEAAQYLAAVQQLRGCKNRAEALEMVLREAIELNLLLDAPAVEM